MLLAGLPRESAFRQVTLGPQVAWSQTDYLLAMVVDLLAAGNWQRGGNKNTKRPKPLPRPGMAAQSVKFGSGSRTVAEMRQALDEWHREA